MVTSVFDNLGGVTAFRIAGNLFEVRAELATIKKLVTQAQWLRIMGPVFWANEYVVYGEIHEALTRCPGMDPVAASGGDSNVGSGA